MNTKRVKNVEEHRGKFYCATCQNGSVEAFPVGTSYRTIRIESESRLRLELIRSARGRPINFYEIQSFGHFVGLWIGVLKCAKWRFSSGQKLNQEFPHKFGLQLKHIVVESPV